MYLSMAKINEITREEFQLTYVREKDFSFKILLLASSFSLMLFIEIPDVPEKTKLYVCVYSISHFVWFAESTPFTNHRVTVNV